MLYLKLWANFLVIVRKTADLRNPCESQWKWTKKSTSTVSYSINDCFLFVFSTTRKQAEKCEVLTDYWLSLKQQLSLQTSV